ncbi:hypothetical protein T484DRAFT_3309765 [Baffinella frigidus]|nr:hypothetical protein T484DRAFT_3309765 [Cryptophyta sp. CCMP2293]
MSGAAHGKKGSLPGLKGSPKQVSSAYRSSPGTIAGGGAARGKPRSHLKNSSDGGWMATSLPDIQAGPMGPSGPSGPEDPTMLSPGRVLMDERRAVETWRRAAELDNPEAQNNLAIALYNGRGTPRNMPEAVQWWRSAAEMGYADAQFNLASCVFHGNGTTVDVPAAHVLFKAAMAQGHAEAMCFVASLYMEGTGGLEKDLDEAFEIYSRASQMGNEEAQYRLWVLEDVRKREGELNNLNSKMGKIQQGFIALQLERAANEEVSQNYHGAGVFLSPGKTLDTQGVRARVAQAKRAEREIKALRAEVEELCETGAKVREERDEAQADAEALRSEIMHLEEALAHQRQRAEGLALANNALSAADVEQKAQIKQLIGENQELTTVATNNRR